MRVAEVTRVTKETNISIKVNLDGTGKTEIEMVPKFFAHMLCSFATHSLIDLDVKASGDLKHHIIEDVSICMGQALKKTLSDTTNISRFGYSIVPMDCSLAYSAIDLSARPYSILDLKLKNQSIEDTATEDINHFFETLAISLQANLHITVLYGNNDHHKVEASFKSFALSFRQATTIDSRRQGIPSSKGVI